MTKEEILQTFSDINYAYNNCSKYDTLKNMLEELTEPCEKCEVVNPCLYCKHEFDPQEREDLA